MRIGLRVRFDFWKIFYLSGNFEFPGSMLIVSEFESLKSFRNGNENCISFSRKFRFLGNFRSFWKPWIFEFQISCVEVREFGIFFSKHYWEFDCEEFSNFEKFFIVLETLNFRVPDYLFRGSRVWIFLFETIMRIWLQGSFEFWIILYFSGNIEFSGAILVVSGFESLESFFRNINENSIVRKFRILRNCLFIWKFWVFEF